MKKQNKLRQTKHKQTMLQETHIQRYTTFKHFRQFKHLMWPSFVFKAAFALGALAHSFSGIFAGRFLKDVATALLDLVCLSLFCFFMSFQTDWMMMRSDICVEHWLLSDSLCKQKSHWIIKINGKVNVWKCKPIFPTDTLQQKIEITDFKNNYLVKILEAWEFCTVLYMYKQLSLLQWSVIFFYFPRQLQP